MDVEVSRAEVAEIPLTAFTSRKKAEQVGGRLVVRRIPDLSQVGKDGQETLFDTWRFHAFFTTTDPGVADTVAADKTHRGHAMIEQVHADLKSSALAPAVREVHRERSVAGARRDGVQPHPRRRHPRRTRPRTRDYRHDPPQAHRRPSSDRVLSPMRDHASTNRLAIVLWSRSAAVESAVSCPRITRVPSGELARCQIKSEAPHLCRLEQEWEAGAL